MKLWPLMALLPMANDLRKRVRPLVSYRSEAIADRGTACELTLYLYSLVSPMNLTQRWWRQWPHSQRRTTAD